MALQANNIDEVSGAITLSLRCKPEPTNLACGPADSIQLAVQEAIANEAVHKGERDRIAERMETVS